METKLPLWITDPVGAQETARQACLNTSGKVACAVNLEINEIDGEPVSFWGCETCNNPDLIELAASAGSAQN